MFVYKTELFTSLINVIVNNTVNIFYTLRSNYFSDDTGYASKCYF